MKNSIRGYHWRQRTFLKYLCLSGDHGRYYRVLISHGPWVQSELVRSCLSHLIGVQVLRTLPAHISRAQQAFCNDNNKTFYLPHQYFSISQLLSAVMSLISFHKFSPPAFWQKLCFPWNIFVCISYPATYSFLYSLIYLLTHLFFFLNHKFTEDLLCSRYW